MENVKIVNQFQAICTLCGKKLKNHNAGIARHMTVFHSGKNAAKQKKFICEECGKGFGTAKAMYGHMHIHSKNISKRIRGSNCSICGVHESQFKTRNSFGMHCLRHERGEMKGDFSQKRKNITNPEQVKLAATSVEGYNEITSDNASEFVLMDALGFGLSFESFSFQSNWDKLFVGLNPGEPVQLCIRLKKAKSGVIFTRFDNDPDTN